jgi:hypothetical protein
MAPLRFITFKPASTNEISLFPIETTFNNILGTLAVHIVHFAVIEVSFV